METIFKMFQTTKIYCKIMVNYIGDLDDIFPSKVNNLSRSVSNIGVFHITEYILNIPEGNIRGKEITST